MSKTLQQIYALNPALTINDTDLFYLVQSPYTPGSDAGISGATMKSIFGTGGTVNPGLQNQLAWYAANGNAISGLLSIANGTLITDAGGAPSISQTLPSAVQNNITRVGTLISGTWHASVIGEIYGGTNQSTYALGDLLYASAANTLNKLSGNTTAVKQYLSQTGTGVISASPVWSTISGSDITGAALTKVDDTNVTLTLGGTPATSLLRAVSLTLGWTGILSGTRGGTGVNNGTNTATYAGNLNFANSFTTVGNFAVTQTYTNTTNVTFPVSGTLATTSQLPTPAALTKTDDTNVTLTLGGSPSTALLQATSLTLGWTGQLAVGRGGTGDASFTPYAVICGGTLAANPLQSIASVGTAGQVLTSNGPGALPTFQAAAASGVVSPGLQNQLAWYAANGSTVSGLTSAASSVLVTSAGSVPSLSTILPAGLTIPGYAASGANADITSMTGLTGYLQAPLGIKDSSGNIITTFDTVASAVNYISLKSSATGVAPSISALGSNTDINLDVNAKGAASVILKSRSAAALSATALNATPVNYVNIYSNSTGNPAYVQAIGSDTDINLRLEGKGTGGAAVKGVSTNSTATAGDVGELISSVILNASAISITTNIAKSITSITLSAGDWDIWGNVSFSTTGTTTFTAMSASISTTNNTMGDVSLWGQVQMTSAALSSNGAVSVPQITAQLSGSTTYYIVGLMTGGGTLKAAGGIYARRRR